MKKKKKQDIPNTHSIIIRIYKTSYGNKEIKFKKKWAKDGNGRFPVKVETISH